jgi:hypothetical protein
VGETVWEFHLHCPHCEEEYFRCSVPGPSLDEFASEDGEELALTPAGREVNRLAKAEARRNRERLEKDPSGRPLCPGCGWTLKDADFGDEPDVWTRLPREQ